MLVLAVALTMWSSLGLSACKNVCERAGEQLLGCLDELCARRPTQPACADRAAFAERLAGGGDCRAEDSPAAERVLQSSCDQLEQLLAGGDAGPVDEAVDGESEVMPEGTE